jgi:hypothetical protein
LHSFVSQTTSLLSDGRVLIFEAQEEKATVSLQRAADFKVGDDAVLSLFWRAGPMPASSISSECVATSV